MSEPSRDSPTCLLFSKTLLAVFVLSLAVWTPQTSESQRTDPLTFSSIMVPDFTIGATLPSVAPADGTSLDRKSTRLNSSHRTISYAVFCLKKKKIYYYLILSITN